MVTALDPVGSCDEARYYRWGRLVVVDYGGLTTVEELRYLAKVEREAVAEHGKFATLNLIRYASLAVPEDVRAYANEMAEEFKPVSLAYAIVVPGRSIGAATFRSVLSGISLVARSRVPQSVFKQGDAALGWLVGEGVLEAEEVPALARSLTEHTGVTDLWGAHGAYARAN